MHALDDVTFQLKKGEVLGVAGESGCGKSTLGLAIVRLLPSVGEIADGSIRFMGRNLVKLSEQQMDKEIRGKQIAMIFQNPQSALNPVFKIETQMIDILRFQSQHQKSGAKKTREELKQQAIDQLKETGIADPAERISNYPFEYSGGMKQRVMISMALSSKTSLLIADEPTTALDVTIEAQINKLLMELAEKYQSSILYISHDLGVLSEITDRVMIMYAGRIFETGQTHSVFDEPRHPYSTALIESLPSSRSKKRRLLTIPGQVPPLDQLPSGCTFHPRCPFAKDKCRQENPSLIEVTPNHWSACLLDEWRGRQRCKWI
ncbi:MAG TPA: ABC transporter ATP-binding protein [Desulfatiglandales bacterium]|nr:ABC transporter ATP-binding protein [Desulfatiglandales bacterium]